MHFQIASVALFLLFFRTILRRYYNKHNSTMASDKKRHSICGKEFTKNMQLFTNSPFQGEINQNTLEFTEPTENPLDIVKAWLTAKQKHLKKYAEEDEYLTILFKHLEISGILGGASVLATSGKFWDFAIRARI